ncbi:LacI family DNA-binding transcriptional regulator [Devosia rhodophyticola]|uniref:LacI family DNA-binding transcriptional regulator n=1 Tax=Devosia rhodophyticola TaxID=3026423 RepID=A0ABY7Z1E2_9HYPH|nr:LacI family DNA-binding transcriptional regulator [Devosia rhodophyticola]WDR07458.1 LacI family DNA-binding transcriptional regulator [Devosia rhodophyticola]
MPRTNKKPATITDVAIAAGMSIGTVSRYINGYEVKPANKERIERAIADLSFSPNALASGMKSADSRMVGLLVPDYDEFHAGLLGNLATTLAQEGLVTLTYCHESNSAVAKEAMRFFRTHRVRALIMSWPDADRNDITEMIAQGVQIVTYDNIIDFAGGDRVVVNNREASFKAVSELIRLGHTRIGAVTGDLRRWTAKERLAGWRDAFEAANIPAPEDLIFPCDWYRADGHRAMEHFWKMDTPPSAIFAANYQISLGILVFCQENDITLPDDLSLFSFDDVEAFHFSTPRVAAIGQPVHDIAQAIKARLLENNKAKRPATTPISVVDCAVHFRESIGPYRPKSV